MKTATPARRSAFTLVELTIVVMVLGILAAVSGPKFYDAMIETQARAAARQVAADLEYARQYAISHSEAQPVTFAVATNSYELTGISHPDHPSQSYEVDLSATAYAASLEKAAFGSDGTAATIQFHRSGRPDHGGEVVLRVGSVRKKVSVDAVTGKAAVSP